MSGEVDVWKLVRCLIGLILALFYLGVGLFFLISGKANILHSGTNVSTGRSRTEYTEGNDARIYGLFMTVTGACMVGIAGLLTRNTLEGKIDERSSRFW